MAWNILHRPLLGCLLIAGIALSPGYAGPKPVIPTAPLASKGALLFSDDFANPQIGKNWREQWPALSIVEGRLNISQAKPEHSAVGLVPVGQKDFIIEFKFKLGGSSSINAVCNDKDFKEGHGGHICRVSLSPRQIFLADDKERLSREIEALKKDAVQKAEVAKRIAGRSASVPMALDPTHWYQLTLEIVNDELRVSLEGKPVGYLRSSGINHPMKSDFYFAVSGQDAQFDDMRIWAAAKPQP